MKNLIDGIVLDSYNIFISFGLPKDELIRTLKFYTIDIDILKEEYCRIKTNLLGINTEFWVAFIFRSSKLTTVCF